MLKEQINQVLEKATDLLEKASNSAELEDIKVKVLGKKGELTSILKQLGTLSAEERPVVGQLANEVRQKIEAEVAEKREALETAKMQHRLKTEQIDVTMPGKRRYIGKKHPLTVVLDEIKEIFMGMGYSIATGPEVEFDYYNFEALNLPKDHPARDTQDTFFISDNILLRSQTSPVQVRVMEKQKPPIRIIAPGRVFRADEVDATHSPLFHQIEGLAVDKNITMEGKTEKISSNIAAVKEEMRKQKEEIKKLNEAA